MLWLWGHIAREYELTLASSSDIAQVGSAVIIRQVNTKHVFFAGGTPRRGRPISVVGTLLIIKHLPSIGQE